MSLPPYGYDDESLIARARLLQLLDNAELDEASLRGAADELGVECRVKVDELLKHYESKDYGRFEESKAALKQMLELQPKL